MPFVAGVLQHPSPGVIMQPPSPGVLQHPSPIQEDWSVSAGVLQTQVPLNCESHRALQFVLGRVLFSEVSMIDKMVKKAKMVPHRVFLCHNN